MRATRMVQQLKNYSYEASLRRLNLLTSKYRKLPGDMIQVFYIVSGKYTTNPIVDFNFSEHLWCGTVYQLRCISDAVFKFFEFETFLFNNTFKRRHIPMTQQIPLCTVCTSCSKTLPRVYRIV